jgi:hypothetical protein
MSSRDRREPEPDDLDRIVVMLLHARVDGQTPSPRVRGALLSRAAAAHKQKAEAAQLQLDSRPPADNPSTIDSRPGAYWSVPATTHGLDAVIWLLQGYPVKVLGVV